MLPHGCVNVALGCAPKVKLVALMVRVTGKPLRANRAWIAAAVAPAGDARAVDVDVDVVRRIVQLACEAIVEVDPLKLIAVGGGQ